jgi:cytidine deaminase
MENASYGTTLCPECGLVSNARIADAQLVAVSVQSGAEQPLTPCGRCRRLVFEVAGPALLVDALPTPLRLQDLLPGAFASSELTKHRR